MGRGVIESGLCRSEQYQLEQRTADPSSPEPNEEWLRVDIKPTYQDADGVSQTGVAEYRRANTSGTIETAPVAALGDSTNTDVIDKIRAYVDAGGSPTGTGFIPHATSGAAYPHKRLQHPTDGQVALHDSLTANAILDSDIAQFESGSLHSSFVGDTSNFSVTTNTPTLTGSYSLKESTGSGVSIVSTSGLGHYPQAGQKISCYVYQGSGADTSPPSYLFGVQDGNNYYRAEMLNELDEIHFRKTSGGSSTVLGTNQSVAINYDTWYDFEVEWYANGDLVGRLWSVDQSTGARQSVLTSFTRNDTEYTSGGVGFEDGSGASGLHAYDNYRILANL